MKFFGKKWDLFKYWLSEYFKHPIENIRQADPIVPGRLYRSFGHVVKAVPLEKDELEGIQYQQNMEKLGQREDSLLMLAANAGVTTEKLRLLSDTWGTTCQFCEIYGVTPCPYYNRLADGEEVCKRHKYIMIRRAKAL